MRQTLSSSKETFITVLIALAWSSGHRRTRQCDAALCRKLRVYGAALTEALPYGNISEPERVLWNRLRDSLGISESDADAIERELQEGPASIGQIGPSE